MVVVFVLGFVLYELIAFGVYAWGDARKNAAVHWTVRRHVQSLRTVAGAVETRGYQLVSLCSDEALAREVRVYFETFVSVAKFSADELRAERRPGLLRRWLDFLLPPLLGIVAALTMVASAFHLWRIVWVAVPCVAVPTVYFTVTFVRQWLAARKSQLKRDELEQRP